jgi:hypothetical protein
MPVNPNCPEPLKSALEQMERHCQSTKTSLRFAAPEMYDQHWIDLQNGLAEVIHNLYEEMQEIITDHTGLTP